MTRVLRSAVKKNQIKENSISNLSISKKSRYIKSRGNKSIGAKNVNNKQSDIWDINSIRSNIFAYIDYKDLLEFNTVCKKWSLLTNSIIHKNIKLIRNLSEIFSNEDGVDAEVIECISNNTKHAPLIKELNFNYKIRPQRAIDVFQTFRFISNLSIGNHEMSQDQFLGMINPLIQLQELVISNLKIKRILINGIYKEAIQLPSALKKLKLHYIDLIDNPELFVQTINSHNSLIEFSDLSGYDSEFLEPFYKPYPSLLNFEYKNHQLQNPQILINAFEQVPQLFSLKLDLTCWTSKLTNSIAGNLSNLEVFNPMTHSNYLNHTNLFLKFSMPTKIKILTLDLSVFGVADFGTLLLNCPDLDELNIILPWRWEEVLGLFHEKCPNLKRLNICRPYRMLEQELYQTEFFTSEHKCKSTLTHLTLKGFKVVSSKAEYFESFKSLKSIKYLSQPGINYNKSNQEFDIQFDMNLWPGYRLLTTDANFSVDVELKRI